MIRSAPVFAVLLSLGLVARAAAQEERTAQQHVERGLAAASAGDTAAALYELSEATRKEPTLALAHYHLARLYSARASAVETDFRDRLAAERSLQKALSLDPKNPLYLLELGKLKLKQGIRVDALRLLRRALEEAKAGGDPAILADVHYQIGTIHERWYEEIARRRLLPFDREAAATELWQHPDATPSQYADRLLREAPKVEDSGWVEREMMMEHLLAALRYDPSHLEAAARVLGQLYDEGRLREYLPLAESLAARVPGDARAHLFLGLGYHAVGQEDVAAAAFERALARLPDDDCRALESLAPVLRRREAGTYEELSEEARQQFEEQFWAFTDPLFLTEANERWIEHVARAAYADLRFAAPELGLRGWETDRGVIYIRYGPPDEIASFSGAAATRTIVWAYGRDGPTFMFSQRQGYRHAQFAGDYREVAAEYRHLQPNAYRIPSLPALHRVPVQIARFRGAHDAEAAVEVHAAIPLDSLRLGTEMREHELETGFFLLDREGRSVERRVRPLVAGAARGEVLGLRSWRVILPPDSFYLVGVEARNPLTWRAATARDTFTAARFESGRLALSDLLLADFLHPRIPEPRARGDFDVRPNPALQYEIGAPVYLYYEIYDLQPDPVGFASYDVTIAVRVKSLTREGGLAALLGVLADAWGFTIAGDDRIEVTFHREERLDGRDRAIGWYSLDLQEVPPGVYEIRVEVRDRTTSGRAERLREIRVIKPSKEA